MSKFVEENGHRWLVSDDYRLIWSLGRWLRLTNAYFAINQGGRFFTFTVYRRPFGLRLYLGADWRGARGPRRAWMWQAR